MVERYRQRAARQSCENLTCISSSSSLSACLDFSRSCRGVPKRGYEQTRAQQRFIAEGDLRKKKKTCATNRATSKQHNHRVNRSKRLPKKNTTPTCGGSTLNTKQYLNNRPHPVDLRLKDEPGGYTCAMRLADEMQYNQMVRWDDMKRDAWRRERCMASFVIVRTRQREEAQQTVGPHTTAGEVR